MGKLELDCVSLAEVDGQDGLAWRQKDEKKERWRWVKRQLMVQMWAKERLPWSGLDHASDRTVRYVHAPVCEVVMKVSVVVAVAVAFGIVVVAVVYERQRYAAACEK